MLEYIEKTPSADRKYLAYLTLAQYYLTVNNFDKAKSALDAASSILEIVEKKDKWRILYTTTMEEYKICLGWDRSVSV